MLLFRPFYYYNINHLNIVEDTNHTYDELKEAYDDVIDYLVFNKDFKTGILKYSEEGKDHFKDCKELFNINFIVFIISFLILIVKKIFYNKKKILNHSLEFYSCILNLVFILFIVISTLIINYKNMFTLFHKVLFPGKDNWLLNSSKDQIINILPSDYFMYCAILFIFIITLISGVIITKDLMYSSNIEKKKK